MRTRLGFGVENTPQTAASTPAVWLPGEDADLLFAIDTIQFGTAGLWQDVAKTIPVAVNGDPIRVIENQAPSSVVGDAVFVNTLQPAYWYDGHIVMRGDAVFRVDTSALGTLNIGNLTAYYIGGIPNLTANWLLVTDTNRRILQLTTVGGGDESEWVAYERTSTFTHNQLNSPRMFIASPDNAGAIVREGHRSEILTAPVSVNFSTGLSIGGRYSDSAFRVLLSMYSLAVFNRDFTAQEVDDYYTWHNSRANHGVSLICVGDSITHGTTVNESGAWDRVYPQQLGQRIYANKGIAPWGMSRGVGSRTAQTMVTEGPLIDALYVPGFSKYILTIMGGTNDPFFGESDASVIHGYLQQWCNDRRTYLEGQGVPPSNIVIGVTTQIDRNAVYRPVLDALNTLIRNNYTNYADVLIDPESRNAFSIALQPAGVSADYNDSAHPSIIGHDKLADYFYEDMTLFI